MTITLNGSTGITTPADTVTGNASVGGTLSVTGATTLTGAVTATTITSPAATALTVQSAGTTAMTIDTSQNVGIGTSSPNNKFNVYGTSVVGRFESTNNTNVVAIAYNSTVGGYLGANGTNLIFGNNAGTEAMRIDSSGNLLVGTTVTNPITSRANGVAIAGSGNINVRGAGQPIAFGLNATSGTNIGFYTDNGSSYVTAGNISSSGSSTSFNTSSDYRLKENVQPMANGLLTVLALNPISYTWKEGYGVGSCEGFIAHELAEVIPQAVTGEKDAVNEDGSIKPQGVDYSKIVVHLVAAMQELSAKNDALEARLAVLEAASVAPKN